jgi:hypothetical protein
MVAEELLPAIKSGQLDLNSVPKVVDLMGLAEGPNP